MLAVGLFAATIVIWLAAVLVWDFGTLRIRALITPVGLLRLIGGFAIALGALFFLYAFVLPFEGRAYFSPFAIGTFLIAVAVDGLIGDAIRRRR